MASQRQRIDPKVLDRAAQLLAGAPCTQKETALAVGMGLRTVEHYLTTPEFRASVEKYKRVHGGLPAEAARVVEELLNAVDDNGEPVYGLQLKGAELAMKYAEQLDKPDLEDAASNALPAGVLRVYPSRYAEIYEGAPPPHEPLPLPDAFQENESSTLRETETPETARVPFRDDRSPVSSGAAEE